MKPDYSDRRRRKKSEIKIIDFREIIYCKAEGNYIRVYLENDSFIETKILKCFESGLPAGIFFRIHRSFLINTCFVTSLNDIGKVTLKTKIELQVSRRNIKELLEILSKNNLIVKKQLPG